MVKRGQEIRVFVEATNIGDVLHTFEVGMTMRHIETGRDFDIPLKSLELGVNTLDNVGMFWTVPEDAPDGNYSVISAIWEGETNGIPFNRLDDEVNPNAFIVN